MAQFDISDPNCGLEEDLIRILRKLTPALKHLGEPGCVTRINLAAAFDYFLCSEDRRQPDGPKFELSGKETLPLPVRGDGSLARRHQQILKSLASVSVSLRASFYTAVMENNRITRNQLMWFIVSGKFCDEREAEAGLQKTPALDRALEIVDRLFSDISELHMMQAPLPLVASKPR